MKYFMQEMKYLSFSDAKGDFIRIGIELATNAQRDTFAENPMKVRFEMVFKNDATFNST